MMQVKHGRGSLRTSNKFLRVGENARSRILKIDLETCLRLLLKYRISCAGKRIPLRYRGSKLAITEVVTDRTFQTGLLDDTNDKISVILDKVRGSESRWSLSKGSALVGPWSFRGTRILNLLKAGSGESSNISRIYVWPYLTRQTKGDKWNVKMSLKTLATGYMYPDFIEQEFSYLT